MAIIPLVYSEPLLKAGYKEYVQWDTSSMPHLAIAGVTGTGKTYCTKLILAKVSKYITDSQITVCDYKGDSDFSFLSECGRFYRFDSCLHGLNTFYNDFLNVQRTGIKNGFHLLVFDEWGAFINSLDKKDAEDAKKKLSILLMLGRSFDYHILLSQQRLNAEDFGKSRDQFNLIILLGNASKEVISMLFHDYKEYIQNDRKRGTGYLLANGADFQPIVVPTIASMEQVNNAIKHAVIR